MFTDNIDDGFTAIKRKLEEGVKNAEKVACNTCQSWGSKVMIIFALIYEIVRTTNMK